MTSSQSREWQGAVIQMEMDGLRDAILTLDIHVFTAILAIPPKTLMVDKSLSTVDSLQKNIIMMTLTCLAVQLKPRYLISVRIPSGYFVNSATHSIIAKA